MARSILLPNFLQTPLWIDLANTIDEHFKPVLDDPSSRLSRLREVIHLGLEAQSRILRSEMVAEDEIDRFDREILIKSLNLVGCPIQDYSPYSNTHLFRMLQYLPEFWYSKGSKSVVGFVSFVLNAGFSLDNMWTDDYVNFVVEGDPSIGTPVYEGGDWYPTTHVQLSYDPVQLSGFSVTDVIGLVQDLSNTNLVIHSMDASSDFPVVQESDGVTGMDSFTDSKSIGLGLVSINEVSIANESWLLRSTVVNPTPGVSDRFGEPTSLSGDYLAVGCGNNDSAGLTNNGSAYVFHLENGDWVLQQTITSPSDVGSGRFGWCVSINGNYLAVSSGTALSGTVYVYLRSGSSWALQATITNPSPSSMDRFGSTLSLYGSYLAVGCPYENTLGPSVGAVYVYVRSGTSWTLQATIDSPTAIASEAFGYAISLRSNRLLVGSLESDSSGYSSGAAHIFYRSGTVWSLEQSIPNPRPVEYASFGDDVSLHDDYAVIGAPYYGTNGVDTPGAAYVYHRTGSSWSLQATLDNPTPERSMYFGDGVSVSASHLAVGAPGRGLGSVSTSDDGAIHVYNRVGDNWYLQSSSMNPRVGDDGYFGQSVHLENQRLLVEAYDDDSGATNSGVVHVYELG